MVVLGIQASTLMMRSSLGIPGNGFKAELKVRSLKF